MKAILYPKAIKTGYKINNYMDLVCQMAGISNNVSDTIHYTIIDEQGLEERFEYMAYQLHVGAFGGDVLKWVYVVLGLTPGFLSISGALLWLKRKKR